MAARQKQAPPKHDVGAGTFDGPRLRIGSLARGVQGPPPTARDVAELLNCSQRGYSNYETGVRDIPTDVLIRLADLYGVSTDYLLGLTDNPKRAR